MKDFLPNCRQNFLKKEKLAAALQYTTMINNSLHNVRMTFQDKIRIMSEEQLCCSMSFCLGTEII